MAKNFFVTVVREIDRQNRANNRAQIQASRDHVRSIREQERFLREQERENKREEKDRQKQHVENRIEVVEEQNEDLKNSIELLDNLLVAGLNTDPRIDFDSLRVEPERHTLLLGDLTLPNKPPTATSVGKPNFIIGWVPAIKKTHAKRILEAQLLNERLLAEYRGKEAVREASIRKLEENHARKIANAKALADDTNAQIELWKTSFIARDPNAVSEYFQTALEKSAYPDEFPQETKVVYVAASKQLVVECDLPKMDDVVPSVKSYKYIKSSDTITETQRPETQRRTLYASVVAQITLRKLWEVFTADTQELVDTIVLSCYVDTINPGTGTSIRPCLVSVRVSRDVFTKINLQQVDPIACLRELNAALSKSPGELAPVRPILDLNMIDPRFVKESDVLSTLDNRSNLMDLTPGEFESLITNLFQKMGLDTKMTQASRDGGVDCVAFDPRPIFGGKVVIQAKRYKNTVGVSAVRDLYGTMQNEGASKGILVTTSGYGKAAFDFANGKPLELLDGANLLYLLNEHSEIDAKIVMPENWQDVPLDNGL